MITEGWEDKTIFDAEKAVVNILRQATCNSNNIPIGLKAINPGSIELVFILMKPITSELNSKEPLMHDICKDSGVRNVQVDGSVIYNHKYSKVSIAPNLVPVSLIFSTHMR